MHAGLKILQLGAGGLGLYNTECASCCRTMPLPLPNRARTRARCCWCWLLGVCLKLAGWAGAAGRGR